MNKSLKQVEEYALDDTDIEKILGKTFIFSYPYLDDVNSIDDIFDSKGRSIMLFLTDNLTTGHWCAMIKNKEGIHYFDPYGIKPEGEKKWLSKEKLEELEQERPVLTKLFRKSGYPIFYNDYKFQQETSKMNTCGRHCCVRLLYKDLSLEEYYDMIKQSGMSPDEFVSKITFQIIKK